MNSQIQISNNKRLARNTAFLYMRMLFAMIVNLYISRLLLKILGVEDYGIYNIVGGVVTLMMFVNASMQGATTVFITSCLGKLDIPQLKNTISSSIQIHLIISGVIFIIGESFGLWFVNTHLNIPESSMYAANWVYQFSLLASCFSVVQIPFNACIIAYERMDVFAYIEMLYVSLRLVVLFFIPLFSTKLIAYSELLFIVTLLIFIIYLIYCKIKIENFYFSTKFRWDTVKPMLLFAIYDLYGNGSFAARQQGTNILINIFFGVLYNAASGIATQVSAIVSTFVSNIQSAFKPQIIKEYSVGNFSRMQSLMSIECEIMILLAALVFTPLYLNLDYVMQLWLKEVPKYSVEFCRLLLIYNVIFIVSQILMAGIHASGKMKVFSFFAGCLNLFCLLLVYIFFKSGLDAYYAYYAFLIILFLRIVADGIILQKNIPELDVFSIIQYSAKSFAILIFGMCLCYVSLYNIDSNLLRLLISFLINAAVVLFSVLALFVDARRWLVNRLSK